jgi:hypothetical protein
MSEAGTKYWRLSHYVIFLVKFLDGLPLRRGWQVTLL